MEFRFLLNGKAIIANTPPQRRLIHLLREDYGITSLRRGCGGGECGICTVLLDGLPVLACLIPVFKIAGSDIVTEEGLRVKKEYQALLEAFEGANYHPCNYCMPSSMVIACSILDRSLDLKEEEILDAFSGRSCSCTNLDLLVKAVRNAGRIMRSYSRG